MGRSALHRLQISKSCSEVWFQAPQANQCSPGVDEQSPLGFQNSGYVHDDPSMTVHDPDQLLPKPASNHQDESIKDIVHPPIVPATSGGGPVFRPPGAPNYGEGSDFYCDYSAMSDYKECSSHNDRSCWLTKKDGTRNFSVFTNYEDVPAQTPIGIDRYYEFDVTDDTVINADGQPFHNAKLFNRKYPGTWVQGCWGDVSGFSSTA